MKSRNVPRFVRLIVPLAGAALFTACGSDKGFEASAPFEDVEDVKVWATSASAVAVYSHAYELLGVADGALGFADPTCPATNDDGTTLTVTGGCTDANERVWEGRATVVRDGDDRTLSFGGFNDNEGTVEVRVVEGPMLEVPLREFAAELVVGDVTKIRYAGTVAGDYTGPTLWNGSGRVARSGFIEPTGSVDATTVDELVDGELCSGQPVSGSTTLEARGDTAVVTYDGATDCDAEQNARLVVNGEDRGLVSGIACTVTAVGADRGGLAAALATLFGIVAAAAVRRAASPWSPASERG
ncbi:MAG TPA: hypothetical protein VFZ53_09830 [Polyangiaceae bacterium]